MKSLDLESEFFFLYTKLFNKDPDHILYIYYKNAHLIFTELLHPKKEECDFVKYLINKKINPLGIEPWLRLRPERHLLSCKLHVIHYIAEAGDTLYNFRGDPSISLIALLNIFINLLHSIFSLVMGFIQLSLWKFTKIL